jgi:amino acid permease
MPAAMSSMGVFTGICVIVFAGLTSGMGLYFLSRCALRIERGHSSFFAVSKRTYPGAAVIFDGAISIKCFGISPMSLDSSDWGRCGGVVSYHNR